MVIDWIFKMIGIVVKNGIGQRWHLLKIGFDFPLLISISLQLSSKLDDCQ